MKQNESNIGEVGEEVMKESEVIVNGELYCESFANFFEECAKLAGMSLAEWKKSEPF